MFPSFRPVCVFLLATHACCPDLVYTRFCLRKYTLYASRDCRGAICAGSLSSGRGVSPSWVELRRLTRTWSAIACTVSSERGSRGTNGTVVSLSSCDITCALGNNAGLLCRVAKPELFNQTIVGQRSKKSSHHFTM